MSKKVLYILASFVAGFLIGKAYNAVAGNITNANTTTP